MTVCTTEESAVPATFVHDDGGRVAAGYKGDAGDCGLPEATEIQS